MPPGLLDALLDFPSVLYIMEASKEVTYSLARSDLDNQPQCGKRSANYISTGLSLLSVESLTQLSHICTSPISTGELKMYSGLMILSCQL
jgi:hypothetical protein